MTVFFSFAYVFLNYRVHEDDSGSYFCRASNTHLQRFITSRRASVTVLAPPSVSVWPQLLTVPVGGSVALQCQVSGSPVPSITWFKSGLSKQTGGRVIKGLSNATLYIQSARSFDEGVYLCYASNSMGTNQSNAVLKVAVSPIIITFAAQVQCKLGAVASLPCKAVGIVPITYTWSKKRGNQHIAMAPNDQTYIDGEGSLHISDVQWSDEGEYYCTAKNRAGQHQKRAFLTVTDRVVLSANSSSDENIVVLHEPVAEQHLLTSTRPTHQTQTLCVSSRCNEPVKYFNEDTTTPQSLRLNPLTQTHSQYFVTQLPPPIFPPPPHPNFKSSNLQVSASKQPVYTENLPLKSPSKSPKDGPTQSLNVFKQQNTEAHGLFGLPTISILETMSHFANTTLPSPLQVESQSKDSNVLSKLKHETALAPPQTWLEPPREPLHLKQGHQPDPTHSETSYSFTNTESSSISKQTQAPTDRSSLEKTTSPPRLQVQPPVFSTQQSPMNSQYSRPNVESFMLNQTASYSVALQTNRSNAQPVNQTNNASTLVNDFPLMNITKQKDTNERGENIEATEKSTSQSPRVTQQAPSWLPVLEKHDIPIVVGVGVSLAFIFITVTFYSMVQKNEPVPTNRAAQRNVGVPKRSASRRAAGRTYENRAFEDDECVAVIEQSPNTRARPPGPGLVTVQLEPTSEEQDVPPSPDLHSVTVETYPEPILDTKIDHSLEEESGLSLSQPSIQLQCAEDWLSGADDNHSPCQDTLPPPSPLLSPSPSLTPKQNESLRSSLTLQSGELSTAPIHHSLSLSHSNSPLLLSHQVSFGPTNVAVDVHFHPVSSPSISIQSSTQISSSSMLTAPVADPQETVHNK
ncbi:hypothetical protein NQD34_007457 [Periophthalmus magnuspinnatus]|nr:hypothetical protein NQD34_007457 [Periophthalmus magnuspinnatus]